MYVPEAIRNQIGSPGGVLVAGLTLLSVGLAGIALHWVGIGAAVVIIFLLIVIEVWREAGRATARLSEVEDALDEAKQEAATIPALKGQIAESQALIESLKEERRQPRAGMEEMLEAIAIHLARMDLVLKHRAIASRTPKLPIMRAEINASGAAELSGVVEGGVDLIREEPLAVLDSAGKCGPGGSEEVRIDNSRIQASFDLTALPPDLAEDIERQGSFNPRGYSLCLAGLCIGEYKTLSDADLAEARALLKGAMEGLARTLRGGTGSASSPAS